MAAPAQAHLVLDDFLPPATAARLLAEMVAAEPQFTVAQVGQADGARDDPTIRSSLRLPGRVGVDLTPLRAAVAAQQAELYAATGITPFRVAHFECSIVAHGDGDFYRTHIDTRTGSAGDEGGHDRLLACVYYLHIEPRRFTGGELAIHRLGPLGGAQIDPAHNRLVAFPAFVPHEVLPVSCPDNAFANRRFSVNCWLHRARGDQGSG